MPSLDVIDADYGPHTTALPDGYHHTAQDTIDKISAKSLQISADLFLETIRLINQRLTKAAQRLLTRDSINLWPFLPSCSRSATLIEWIGFHAAACSCCSRSS